jgi:UDP-N-acetylmuramoylalanine--D-glutamate ligase
MDLRNKKVTVVGLGESGLAASRLLLAEGAVVSATDNNDDANVKRNALSIKEKYVDTETGGHTEKFLEDTELMVVSPGVENSSLPLRYAQREGIPVISELELAYGFCKGPIVAVTGTNGKSTVVSLLGEILRRAGIPVNVCGNIGNPLSGEIQKIKRGTVVILEVSSFQLERITSFRPRVSVILNVTDDHLDRHRDFKEYFDLKTRIFENQKSRDTVILNHDDGNLRKLARSRKIPCEALYFSATEKVKGAYFDRGEVKISLKNREKSSFRLGEARLKGVHNLENILASALVAASLGAKASDIKKAVEGFTPLGHRFEKIAEINRIEFIDDSKATNVDSTSRALGSLKAPAILIAGGKDKNLSYGNILPAVKRVVKKIILIGETRERMRGIFKNEVALEESDSLEEAVSAAYKSASPGDSVVLSPMCSSFDMFRDYRHRGEVFRKAVEKLKVTSLRGTEGSEAISKGLLRRPSASSQ